ncbi:MAG: hypothetical protein ACRDTE_23385, partial [Pseudonocardiaceae bacterium]
VLALIAGGLAVDLGFMAHEARDNQKVADLAALDAVRVLPADPTIAATESAQRNGFTATTPPNFVVEAGTYSDGVFTPTALGDASAVRVRVMSVHENQFPFLSGGQNVVRRGIASAAPMAGFSIGSGVANVDTKKSVLDPMLGDMIDGTVNVASYQGLANSTVSLTALQTQFLAQGMTIGSPEELLDTEMTLAQLFTATGNALVLNGDTANAAVFCRTTVAPLPVNCNALSLAAQAHASGTITLRDLMNVAAGSEAAAVASQFNVLQLLTGSAAVINGSNTVAVPGINLGIPGVMMSSGSLTLIERPRAYFGPAGDHVADPPHVSTGQADLTVSTTLSVLGAVTGSVSLRVTAGTADGWLTNVDCTSSPLSTTVHARANAATVTPNIALTLAGLPLGVSANSSAPGGTGDLTFLYPLYPDPSNPAQQSIGAPSLGITTTVAGTGNALVDALNAAVITALRPILQSVVNALDTLVIQPVLDGLGISMGTADVKGLDPLTCGTPTLVG